MYGVDTYEETGQTMAEYAVVLGVITVAVVASFTFLAQAMEAALNAALAIIRLAFS
jgi:Flp pilus assembly pilin Flp